MAWAIDLLERDGTPSSADKQVAAFRAVWSLAGSGSFEAEVPEDLAADWLSGQRRIVLRDDATVRWQGWLESLVEDTQDFNALAAPGGALLKASGLGLAAPLELRVVHGDFDRFMVVGTTVAWNLIEHAQAQSDGDYGFTLGSVTGVAPARTRHFCDGDNILEAINELAGKDPGGFDWEIDEDGAFNAWVGGRGSASGETLARSQASAWSVDNHTADLITYATALGDTDKPCGAPLVVESSGLEATYGRREGVVDLDTNDAGELSEAADEELRARGAARIRVKATFHEAGSLGVLPWSWGAVWLGDSLTVNLPAHFGGNQTMRVIEVALSVEPPEFGFIEYELEAA